MAESKVEYSAIDAKPIVLYGLQNPSSTTAIPLLVDSTGKLKVSGLSDYAKLAISITTADLATAITNSTLVAGQWYLLTDFQNICTIADSQGTSDYTTGDVEQIYVKALSTNTLQREAVSKTFPDEVVEFNPTFSDVTASLYLSASGNGSGVDNANTTFTADTYGSSVDELQFGGTLVDEFNDATISYIYYYNGVSGNEFYLYGYEKDNIWEYDDVNDIFKLNKTPYNYYDEYSSGSSSFFSISITDATHLVLGCPAWIDFSNQRDSGGGESSFYLSDGENAETYDFDQKGVTWDYDAGTDTITILSGSVSLTDPNLSMEFSGTSYCDNTAYNTQFSTNGLLDLSVSGSVFEIDSSYVVYSVKGKIEARRNTKFDFYCQADYRVQKVRRYKALCNNWSAGTYNPGNIVRYSSYIYICLKQTTQTPSTSATNWFRMFGDSYNLSNSISIACSVQSISTNITIDPASYTDMYICNDKISNFDAFTEKINTQILKHPDADQTKPLNVTFYNGFHGCQNAIITAHETHSISNITNSTVNFVNSVINSAINYSTISSGQYCILWQVTYLSALQLYQVLSSSIDYTTIIIASGSIFRNGITKSIMTSVANTIFAAKPSECNIINLSITDQWGSSFSGTYINKMYNCTFNSSVLACQFNGDTYYTNWYSNCYRNKFMSNCYGLSNTVRQQFYYMADNFFAQNVALNYFSTTGGDITTNKFFGSFSNNFTTSVNSYSTYAISTNTFNGDFIYNTGGGKFSITNNFGYAFKYNQFNNSTSYYARMSENFFGSDFGGADVGNIFNNTTADFNFRYNASTNVWYSNTFTKGSIEYNTFLGRASLNVFGGTTTQAFTYNVCSPYFSSNTIDTDITKNFFPPYFQGKTLNSSTAFNYTNYLNAVAKETISTSSASYTVTDQYSVVFLTNTGASQTVVLPAAKGTNRQITIVKLSALSYPATIDANASDTIEDALTYTLNRQYEAVTLQDKETGKWYIVDGYKDEPYISDKQIAYGDANGNITSEAGFEYDDSTNTLSVANVATPQVKAQDSDGLLLTDDGNNGIFVKDGGNVGIGTTSPTEKLEVDGNIQLTTDGNLLKMGTGEDMTIQYTGTVGRIDTSLVAPSDLQIDCGANKTLVLETPVYDDLRVTPAGFDRAGVADPALVSYQPGGNGLATYLYEFQKDDIAYFTVQLPHNYKVGEDIKVHVHWTPGANGATESGNTVGWKIDYSWANIGSNFVAMATADLSDACDGTDHKHQMTPDVTITGSGKDISSMLICNIKRTDTGTDDTWAGTASGALPMILEIDFHYPIDTMGSRDWGSK